MYVSTATNLAAVVEYCSAVIDANDTVEKKAGLQLLHVVPEQMRSNGTSGQLALVVELSG